MMVCDGTNSSTVEPVAISVSATLVVAVCNGMTSLWQ